MIGSLRSLILQLAVICCLIVQAIVKLGQKSVLRRDIKLLLTLDRIRPMIFTIS